MISGELIKMINETILRLDEEKVRYFEDIKANFTCKTSEKNYE